MIAGLVTFDLPAAMTLDELLALYRTSAEGWVTNQELIEKLYLFDQERGRGGGVYLWPSREAAQRNLGADYAARIQRTYGASPHVRLVDAMLRVEPRAQRISAVGV